MNTLKQTTLGRIIPSIFIIFLFLSSCTTHREIIVNSIEDIVVYTDNGPITVRAKIDSGAESSSVALSFVKKYGLDIHVPETWSKRCPNGQSYIKSANGGQCRSMVVLYFRIKGNLHTSYANVSRRSHLSTPILIGSKDLAGVYLIRPIVTNTKEDLDEAEEENEN